MLASESPRFGNSSSIVIMEIMEMASNLLYSKSSIFRAMGTRQSKEKQQCV